MRKLCVPLAAIDGDSGFTVEQTLTEPELRPDGAEHIALHEGAVSGTLSQMDTEYLFNGTIRCTFEHPCDRCLETATQEHRQEVTWYFERGVAAHPFEELVHGETVEEVVELDEEIDTGPELEHVRHFEGDTIDLGPHVWEEMLLIAPSKFLCKEDCAGLCPSCGANLNNAPCGCPTTEEKKDSGFAVLKDMFPNLQSGSTEE